MKSTINPNQYTQQDRITYLQGENKIVFLAQAIQRDGMTVAYVPCENGGMPLPSAQVMANKIQAALQATEDLSCSPDVITRGKQHDGNDGWSDVVVFKGGTDVATMRSHFEHPDGTGPCRCSSCDAGHDCCGQATATAIRINWSDRQSGMITVEQTWTVNI